MHDAARDRLITDHLGLATSIADSCYQQLELGSLMPFNDVLAYAREGLVQAAARYSPHAGAKFSTFSYRRIRGAVIDGVRKANRSRANNRYAKSLASSDPEAVPADEQGAALLAREDNVAVEDLPTDPQLSPEAQVDARQVRRLLLSAIDQLSDRQRTAIIRHFYGGEQLTEIGRDFGYRRPKKAFDLCARALSRLSDILGEALGEPARAGAAR